MPLRHNEKDFAAAIHQFINKYEESMAIDIYLRLNIV